MIGFREFIEEGWSRPHHTKGYRSHDPRKDDYWQHKKTIDGHEVEVRMEPRGFVNDYGRANIAGKGIGHSVNYNVDKSFARPSRRDKTAYPGLRTPSPETAQKILKHVHSKIIQFRKRRNPKFMMFSSEDPIKDKLHRHLVKHLADKHGGKDNDPGISGIRMVKFNGKK